jgi:putative transposase
LIKELNTENVAVNIACNTLAVSESGYYSWQVRPESAREKDDVILLARIRAIFERSKQTYGSPRITEVLRGEGLTVNEKRVARVMRENEIRSEAVKKFKICTTDSKHDLPIADRIFETEHADVIVAPNQVYVGDITYIATGEGWLFLAIFLDLFTRKIVGFSMRDHMRTELVIEALKMALGRQDVAFGECLAHTDRGSQFAAEDFRHELNEAGIIASMSRRGNCWDNAHCESFFHSLKTELVYRTEFKTREEAKQAIFEWIETWYNRERLHSSIGYMAPEKFEKLALAA